MGIFSIDYVVFHLGSYTVSLIELIGTLAGLISVWWAARANILTWPSGIVNATAFCLLFYQARLYSDAMLQVFFLVMTVYGWRNWASAGAAGPLPVSSLRNNTRILLAVGLVAGALTWGLLMRNVHVWLPSLFPEPAALPLVDAFISLGSVLATFLLAQKKWESWLLWIMVDVASVFAYFYKGLGVVGVEYIVFLGIAAFGLRNWLISLRDERLR